MAVKLTEGAISMLISGKWQPTDVKPVLQVIDIRTLQTQTSSAEGGGENKERYLLLLSDGSFHQQGILVTHRNELVRSQQLQKGSIVRLTEFVCNAIRDRSIIIVLDLDVILGKCDIIGDGKAYIVKSFSQPSTSMSAAPMQSHQPATMMDSPQTFAGVSVAGSVPQPNLGSSLPIYPPQQEHSTSFNSYGNSLNFHPGVIRFHSTHFMAVVLTEGAISMLTSGKWQSTEVKPVLQVVDIQTIKTQTSSAGGGREKERYRLLLSDGSFHQQGMLATQHNELVRSQQLQKGSIVRLTDFVCNVIRDRTIIIVIDLVVILGMCDIIGDVKPCTVRPFSEPTTSTSAARMQSNEPATMMGSPQTFMGVLVAASVPQPNLSASLPIFPPQQEHSASFNSYGNSLNFHPVRTKI